MIKMERVKEREDKQRDETKIMRRLKEVVVYIRAWGGVKRKGSFMTNDPVLMTSLNKLCVLLWPCAFACMYLTLNVNEAQL